MRIKNPRNLPKTRSTSSRCGTPVPVTFGRVRIAREVAEAGEALAARIESALNSTEVHGHLWLMLKAALTAYETTVRPPAPELNAENLLKAFKDSHAAYEHHLANRKPGSPMFTYSGWLQHVLATLPDGAKVVSQIHDEFNVSLPAKKVDPRACPKCTDGWTRHIKRGSHYACMARHIDASGNYDTCGCSEAPPEPKDSGQGWTPGRTDRT